MEYTGRHVPLRSRIVNYYTGTLSSAAISTRCSSCGSCSRSLLLLVESFTHTCKRHMQATPHEGDCRRPVILCTKRAAEPTPNNTNNTHGSAHLQLLLKLSVVDGGATALRAARALLALTTSSGSSSGSSPGSLCGSCHRLCVPLLSL
jgi:hypothetical protein